MNLGPLSPCETAVRTALRSASPDLLDLEDLFTGDFSVEQLEQAELASALISLEAHKMAVQTFGGWGYVDDAPGPAEG